MFLRLVYYELFRLLLYFFFRLSIMSAKMSFNITKLIEITPTMTLKF